MIAVMVYLVGGCVYQRTVMNQRGWYQLPNYALWAGLWNFLSVSNPSPSSDARLTLTGYFHNPYILMRAIPPQSKRI
jgi:hypothetical protein